MATKSILKNININDKKLAHTFVESLCNAKYEPTKLSRECKDVTKDKIKEFFKK